MTESTHKSAVISTDGLYRYQLTRRWGVSGSLSFVMLNPSTADADVDDPTIRRCIGFAKRENYGGIKIYNLFAFRATKPSDLYKASDPVGEDNRMWLKAMLRDSKHGLPVICGWGAHEARGEDQWLRSKAEYFGAALHCLGCTKSGAPRHPLYLPSDAEIIRYG